MQGRHSRFSKDIEGVRLYVNNQSPSFSFALLEVNSQVVKRPIIGTANTIKYSQKCRKNPRKKKNEKRSSTYPPRYLLYTSGSTHHLELTRYQINNNANAL